MALNNSEIQATHHQMYSKSLHNVGNQKDNVFRKQVRKLIGVSICFTMTFDSVFQFHDLQNLKSTCVLSGKSILKLTCSYHTNLHESFFNLIIIGAIQGTVEAQMGSSESRRTIMQTKKTLGEY